MKHIIGLAMAGFLFAACQSDTYYIKGEASHLNDSTVLYLTADLQNDSWPMDSMIVCNGRFTYSGTTDSIRLCRLYEAGNVEHALLFFNEPGHIYIELSPQPGLSRVSGTKINNEWQALNDTVAHYDQRLRQLIASQKDSLSPRYVHSEADNIYNTLKKRISEAALRNRDNALGHFISTSSEL